MKFIAITILLLGIFLRQSVAEEAKSFAPAEPYQLSTNEPTYFCGDSLTDADYTIFAPDGKYVRIGADHMSVRPYDNGTWTQTPDGTVTLFSTKFYADIICGPLGINVGTHDNLKPLADLRRKIADFLESNPKDNYSCDNLRDLDATRMLSGHLLSRIIPEVEPKMVTHLEIIALLKAVDDFLNDPSIRNIRLVPLSYKDKVFLVNLNKSRGHRNHKKVCEKIDRGTGIIYNEFMISEEQFEKSAGKPYSFKFYPKMNKITGAE